MPASSAATCRAVSGRVMSRPETSPKRSQGGDQLVLGSLRDRSSRYAPGAHAQSCRSTPAAASGSLCWGAVMASPRMVVRRMSRTSCRSSIAAGAVHGRAVVPDHQVPLPPGMGISESRLRRVFGQVADEGARLRHRPADDAADMRRQIQRLSPGDRMGAHQAVAHRAQLVLVVRAIRLARKADRFRARRRWSVR